MKTTKVVISGSSSLQQKVAYWKHYFKSKGFEIIAFPEVLDSTKETSQHLEVVYKDFYRAIRECDVFFLMNEDKNGITGYIGANGTAELIYALMLKLEKKPIDIYIAKLPSEEVLAHDEVAAFIQAGWVNIYNHNA